MTGQYQRICIVFLDSDLTIHGKISADTGDAQACVQPPSRENGRLDILNSCRIPPIFGGSLIQASPPDAIFSYSRDPLRVEAAVGAGVALRDLHTAKTTIEFHLPLSFLSGLAFGSVVCGCAVCDNFEKILPGSGWQSRAGWVLAIFVFLKNLAVGTYEILQLVAPLKHSIYASHVGGCLKAG